MIQRLISMVVIIAFLSCLIGCTKTTRFHISEVESIPKGNITRLVLKTGEIVEFDLDGGTVDTTRNMIVGYVADPNQYGKLIETKYEDIAQVQVTQIAVKQNLIWIGTIVILGLATLLFLDAIDDGKINIG